jgi:hypothetical protein
LRFLHPADVVGLPVKFLQGIDHFINGVGLGAAKRGRAEGG